MQVSARHACVTEAIVYYGTTVVPIPILHNPFSLTSAVSYNEHHCSETNHPTTSTTVVQFLVA